jgi:hypothetical protein
MFVVWEETRMILKAECCLLLAAALFMAGCATGENLKSIELVEGRMEHLRGEDPESVIRTVTEQLGFRFLSKWNGMNPTPETVVRNTPRQASFSPQEAMEIFREEGFYDVMIYVRSDAEERVSFYDVDAETHAADDAMFQLWHNQTQKYRSYILARLVFRDKRLETFKLIHVDVAL